MIEVNNIEIQDNLFDLPVVDEAIEIEVEEDTIKQTENTTIEKDTEKEEVENKKKKQKASKKKAAKQQAAVDAPNANEIAIYGTDITNAKLDEYKQTYGKVYRSIMADNVYIWHRLTRSEFSACIADTKEIKDLDEKYKIRQELFVKYACIYPSENVLDDIFADNEFIAQNLCDEILQYSGFAKPFTSEL